MGAGAVRIAGHGPTPMRVAPGSHRKQFARKKNRENLRTAFPAPDAIALINDLVSFLRAFGHFFAQGCVTARAMKRETEGSPDPVIEPQGKPGLQFVGWVISRRWSQRCSPRSTGRALPGRSHFSTSP